MEVEPVSFLGRDEVTILYNRNELKLPYRISVL